MTALKLKIVIVALFGFISILVFSGTTTAFSNVMPDGADTSGATSTWMVSMETRYVRRSNAQLAVWLPVNNGTIRILNANYCTGNSGEYIESEDYYGSTLLANGSVVTEYNVNGVRYQGRKYNGTDDSTKSNYNPACAQAITINVSGLTTVVNGYYQVNIDVNYMLDVPAGYYAGVVNKYRINTTNAAGYVGVREGMSGYTTTQEQTDSDPTNPTFYARFGTCDLPSAQDVSIYFYDLDNAGGAGAQRNGPVTVALRDETTSSWVSFGSSSSGGSFNASRTVWTPPSIDNSNQSIRFRAEPDHRYRLEIRNVYYNNTIQYSIPFSQIYYAGCSGIISTAEINPNSSPNNTDIDTVTAGNQVMLSVDTLNISNTGSDQFGWYIERNTNGGAYTRVTPATGSTNTNIAPSGTRLQQTYTVPTATGTYCWKITLTTKPAYALWGPNGNTREVCFTVGGTTTYTPVTERTGGSGTTNDYEKGGTPTTLISKIRVDNYPCDLSIAPGTFVNSRNWQSRPLAVNGLGPTVSGTVEFTNCTGTSGQIRIIIPALSINTTIATISGNSYELFSYTPSGTEITDMDDSVPGTQYGRETYIEGATPEVAQQSFTVYSAPFVRFYGNDVRVCGSGETNRFVFDNILGDPNRGSWAAFATIFQLDNNPADNLKGLQSSRINGNFPAGLSTNWPSATCNPPTIPGSGSVTVIDNSTTINPDLQYYFRRSDSGDITITRDQIITNIVTSAFNPNTHPVVVIHAVNGNINIAPNVTRIDAVLIASGDINTCNIADKGVWEKVPADGGCNNQLVINGAMVANKINFQRTWGSRFLAPPTTTHTTRVNLAPRDLDNDETAEVVNFPWYLHFITLPGFPNQAETQFDAYYSLPPRL